MHLYLKKIFKGFYINLLFLFPLLSQGQQDIELQVVADKDNTFFQKQFLYQTVHADSAGVRLTLKDLLFSLYAEGYLAATYDSIKADTSNWIAYLHVGNMYKWVDLYPGNLDEEIRSQVGFREKLFRASPFHYTELIQLYERMLIYYENNGYPFAVITLDSIQIHESTITAKLNLTKNRYVVIDSIYKQGDASIKTTYLENYLGIKAGSPYNESIVSKVGIRIRELPFATEEKPFAVTFFEEGATLNLFLEEKKVSQLDGLIGLLPNDNTPGQILITGELHLKIINPFGSGKKFKLDWQQFQSNTQELSVNFLQPYIFSTPIGLELSLELYKKDTSYIDVMQELGIQYMLIGANHVKVFAKSKQTNLLNVDTAAIITSHNLPSNIDIAVTTYGLGYLYEKLDYRFNPRKGIVLEAEGGAGTKRIKENNLITGLSDPIDTSFAFSTLYDSLNIRSAQYQLTYRFDWYIPFMNRSTVHLRTKGGGIFTDDLFQNEMFRIGGMQVLRGFDEESIYASLYNVFSVEYRFLLGLNSYFFLFGDFGYVENEFNNTTDLPYGFGTGISFETKAGIFTVNYALGSQQGNPINFNSGKIHFGYINYF